MATVALVKNTLMANSPFLIRKYDLTGGATAAAITHGETRAPDLWFITVNKATPTVTTASVYSVGATTVTVDCLGDAADEIVMFLIWLSAASGGTS